MEVEVEGRRSWSKMKLEGIGSSNLEGGEGREKERDDVGKQRKSRPVQSSLTKH